MTTRLSVSHQHFISEHLSAPRFLRCNTLMCHYTLQTHTHTHTHLSFSLTRFISLGSVHGAFCYSCCVCVCVCVCVLSCVCWVLWLSVFAHLSLCDVCVSVCAQHKCEFQLKFISKTFLKGLVTENKGR